jgi:membrane-associated phospholipid phosphatase
MNSLHHGSGFVQVAANPYAAMPSLHAADALIVGVVLITVTRRTWLRLVWALWPLWVWFCVMATANHFWLDVVGGIVVALLALPLVPMFESRRLLRLVPKLRSS